MSGKFLQEGLVLLRTMVLLFTCVSLMVVTFSVCIDFFLSIEIYNFARIIGGVLKLQYRSVSSHWTSTCV